MAIDVKDKIVVQSVLDYYLQKINTACKENYSKKVTIMPTAEAKNLGMIVQYLGGTTNLYTHAFFYECVLNDDGVTYSWKNLLVNSPIVQINTEFDLPVTGAEGVIYITRTGALYNWDDANLKYIEINPNYDIISGGSANS